jgi:uncharacterized protein with von Willebrand factor type A (vWA) domain
MLKGTIFENNKLKQIMEENKKEAMVSEQLKEKKLEESRKENCKEYIEALSNCISGYHDFYGLNRFSEKKFQKFIGSSTNIKTCPELKEVASQLNNMGITLNGKKDMSGENLVHYGQYYGQASIRYDPLNQNLEVW